MHHCQTKNQNIFWGGGTAPSLDPSPTGEGNTPSRHPTPLGVFGASIIAPSALSVPVPFHLRLEHWPCARSGRPAKKAPISSWDFMWNCHYLFKCTQDNSLWPSAQMLQTTSCSAVFWSQSHLSSHSLINNVIVCNKSCYCSIINRKLNNK